jgi:hypothetical protein
MVFPVKVFTKICISARLGSRHQRRSAPAREAATDGGRSILLRAIQKKRKRKMKKP